MVMNVKCTHIDSVPVNALTTQSWINYLDLIWIVYDSYTAEGGGSGGDLQRQLG